MLSPDFHYSLADGERRYRGVPALQTGDCNQPTLRQRRLQHQVYWRSFQTRRSYNVRWTCSTRPLNEQVLVQMPMMFSSFMARPNRVWPSPPVACFLHRYPPSGLIANGLSRSTSLEACSRASVFARRFCRHPDRHS